MNRKLRIDNQNTEIARKLLLYAQVKTKVESPTVYDPNNVLSNKAAQFRRDLLKLNVDPMLLDLPGEDLETLILNSVQEHVLSHRVPEES